MKLHNSDTHQNRHSGWFWKSLSYPLYSQEISAKPVTLPTLLLSLDQLVAGEDIFIVTLQYVVFFSEMRYMYYNIYICF